MHFVTTKHYLNQGLSQVSRLAAAKMPMPILNNILLSTDEDKIVLSVTDLELGIQTAFLAEIQEHGSFTVPARLLQEFIQASNEERLEGKVTDNATLTLQGDQSNVKMRGLDASEFPGIPFLQGEPSFVLKGSALKEAIDMVAFATAIDDTRPVLAGIYLKVSEGELVLAATDSYRLAEKKVKISETTKLCSAIVPKRTLLEVSRLLSTETGDISVFVGDNQIQFMFGVAGTGTKVVSRLIEGNYPPYQSIIPNGYQTRVTAHQGDFVGALKMAQLFAREAGNLITMTMVPSKGMTIQSLSSQRGESTNQFTAITEGDELKVSFNVKFLLDALAVISAENIFLEFNGPDKPVIFRPSNTKEYMSLVMPLKTD